MKKFIYLMLGLLGLGLGAAGTLIPVLPTVPFLMLSAFCFARSSRKLHQWFVATKLYQENLADLTAGKGMTGKAKIRVMVTVTVLMAAGFLMMSMKGITIGCMVLALVWVLHLVYFLFAIKTIPAKEAAAL